jgi:hypothetical protein
MSSTCHCRYAWEGRDRSARCEGQRARFEGHELDSIRHRTPAHALLPVPIPPWDDQRVVRERIVLLLEAPQT